MNIIGYSFRVNASIDRVWHKLTTTVGIKSFFSPNASIEWIPGGKFEIYFDMDQPVGQRGSEQMIILSMEEESSLSFTWNNPIQMVALRHQRTVVTFELEALDQGTQIIFTNTGYGKNEAWEKSLTYFRHAWGSIVLPRLIYALEEEVIDWEAPQDVSEYNLNT